MVSERILVAGASGERGRRVFDFLKSRGYNVFGADKVTRSEDTSGNFFKMNLRHRDSLWLLFEVTKPDTIIYCATSPTEENYSTFLKVILSGLSFGVEKIMLVYKDFPHIDDLYDTVYNIERFAIGAVCMALEDKNDVQIGAIDDSDNLLKEVKRFVKDKA